MSSPSYNDIAAKLLGDKLHLTALELYAELLDSGKENKLLRDFFSNPGNFEPHANPLFAAEIGRSGSQATLDSLDFARLSEDGERGSDDKVAVLEFELRKARETISSLRNNLTVAIESESTNSDAGSSKIQSNEAIKPYEQRALNFLINEYMLMHGYKLTSITFADENEDQDFEDWDDVGLNISKPAELLTIYREGLKQSGCSLVSVGCQTDFYEDNNCDEVEILSAQVEDLKIKLEEINAKLLSSTIISKVEEDLVDSSAFFEDTTNADKLSVNISNETASDRFEMESKGNGDIIQEITKDNSPEESFNDENEWVKDSASVDPLHNSRAPSDRLREIFALPSQTKRPLLKIYEEELISQCVTNVPDKFDNGLLENLLVNGVTNSSLADTLYDTLPRIIPNIILNRREEVIPLLVGAIYLNPDSSKRDNLLQLLFNMKKRPSLEERKLILLGIISLAKWSGETFVENEILPQCWEQIGHKYAERRLLVAESCSALIPFVSTPIRNSLVLSILQQMSEDKDEIVRETVVKAFTLIVAFCEDADKYQVCEDFALSTLEDESSLVLDTSIKLLFPVFAKWSLDIEKLLISLFQKLLHKLNKYIKLNKSESSNNVKSLEGKIIAVLRVIDSLLPFVFVSVASVDAVLGRITDDMTIELPSGVSRICTKISNPKYFHKGSCDVGMLFYEFDKLIAENTNITWDEMGWFLDVVMPDLLNDLNHVDVTQQIVLQCITQLFSHISVIFGKSFTLHKVKPLLLAQIQNLEQILSSFHQYPSNLSLIPVYLVSVLNRCDSPQELGAMLKRFICALPLCGTPLTCLEISIKGLCAEDQAEMVVEALWDGVVHHSPLVRSAAAHLFISIIRSSSAAMLATRIAPALVTLASDSDMMVRTATVPALGNLISDCTVKEVRDKAYMQLQSFLNDAATKDNHSMLRQIVLTLGNIFNSCDTWFREEIVLPHLMATAAYTAQMSNQTRKTDMVAALVDAFSSIVYCSHNLTKKGIQSCVLPGLKHLENIDSQSATVHRETISAMVREVEYRVDGPSHLNIEQHSTPIKPMPSSLSADDVRSKMSKIFTSKPSIVKATNLSNLQGMFRKK